MTEIADLSAADLSAAYRNKTLSPVDVVDDVLARIDTLNPIVNAFCLVDREGAVRAAAASERRWHAGDPLSPIDGVPATVKDLLVHRTWPTTFGSHVIGTDVSGTDAPAVARLREAGAVLLGLTTTPELGWKAVTDSPRYGVTRNPWNLAMTPGGSSGGAAVAAALNLGCLHIGTDGGGSIRIPASMSGVFGIKPTFGRVPAYPASIMGTLAHIGPITRTVADAALMLNEISRPDHRDWCALPPQPPLALPPAGDRPLAGLKIAYSPDLGRIAVDAEVAAAVRQGVDVLADLGAQVSPADLAIGDATAIFETLWFSAARNRLAKLGADETERLDKGLCDAASLADGLTLNDYVEANLARAALAIALEAYLHTYDALVTPTLPTTAFAVGRQTPSGAGRWTSWAGFNFPFNLSQQPSCSVPCGMSAGGLPIGLQITTAKYADALALRMAAAFAAARPAPHPTDESVNTP